MEIKKEDLIKSLRKEMASKGGKATLKKHGKEYFKNLANKRWGNKPVDK